MIRQKHNTLKQNIDQSLVFIVRGEKHLHTFFYGYTVLKYIVLIFTKPQLIYVTHIV